MCREMLSDYAPSGYAIDPRSDGTLVTRRVVDLLPDKWHRAERYPALDSQGSCANAFLRRRPCCCECR